MTLSKFIEVVVWGVAGNFGSGGVLAVIAVPLVYWLLSRKKPERKLSWDCLLGLLILASFATGLTFSAIERLAYTAETQYKAVFPALQAAFVIAAALLTWVWHLNKTALPVSTKRFIAFLVFWLVIGGGYLRWEMSRRVPPSDLLFLIVFTPLIVATTYRLIVRLYQQPKEKQTFKTREEYEAWKAQKMAPLTETPESEKLTTSKPTITSNPIISESSISKEDNLKNKLEKQQMENKEKPSIIRAKLPLLWVGIIILLIVFAYTIYPTLYRYDRIKSGDSETIIRINRMTGSADILRLDGWSRMESTPTK